VAFARTARALSWPSVDRAASEILSATPHANKCRSPRLEPRARAGQVKASPAGRQCRAGRRDGWLNCGRTGSRCFDTASGEVLSSALLTGGRQWLIFSLVMSKRFGAVDAVPSFAFHCDGEARRAARADRRRQDQRPLRLIAGLERPRSWQRVIHGRMSPRKCRRRATLPSYSSRFHLVIRILTVYHNLAFPLRSPARRMDEGLVRRRVQQVAELSALFRAEALPIAPRPCPAAKCRGWRSAARWCGEPASI